MSIQKLDPYINVDPGTMSPFQHGEVYVTDDGAETDLDLGHYERFTHARLTKNSNFTTGKIYQSVIRKERRGDYLGRTVQVIPPHHGTRSRRPSTRASATPEEGEVDVAITEIGGTVGDIESLPFLEAIRQYALERPRGDVIFVHITLLPYLRASGELKTKPTQQSVGKLREIGIQPDVLICRTEKEMTEGMAKKISLFCNVRREAVIEERDVDHTIYEVPVMLVQARLDRIILDHLGLPSDAATDLSDWEAMIEEVKSAKREVEIAVVGKYIEAPRRLQVDLRVPRPRGYREPREGPGPEALGRGRHEGRRRRARRRGRAARPRRLRRARSRGEDPGDPVWARARTTSPSSGSAWGCNAPSSSTRATWPGSRRPTPSSTPPHTPHPVIHLMESQEGVLRQGGARCGSAPTSADSTRGSLAHRLYGKREISERHRHRFEFNNEYRDLLGKAGLRGERSPPTPWTWSRSSRSPRTRSSSACSSTPEFQSSPLSPAPHLPRLRGGRRRARAGPCRALLARGRWSDDAGPPSRSPTSRTRPPRPPRRRAARCPAATSTCSSRSSASRP